MDSGKEQFSVLICAGGTGQFRVSRKEGRVGLSESDMKKYRGLTQSM